MVMEASGQATVGKRLDVASFLRNEGNGSKNDRIRRFSRNLRYSVEWGVHRTEYSVS